MSKFLSLAPFILLFHSLSFSPSPLSLSIITIESLKFIVSRHMFSSGGGGGGVANDIQKVNNFVLAIVVVCVSP